MATNDDGEPQAPTFAAGDVCLPNLIRPVADYTAMIAWGDGTAANTGMITYDASTGVFTVHGSHTYADAGTETTTVTLTHDMAPAATATSTATVADLPLTAHGKPVQAV